MCMKFSHLAIFILIALPLIVSGQGKPVLGNNYNKYIREMESYYSTHPKGKGSGYKQYMRWRHKMDVKMGRDSIIRNFSVLDNAEMNRYKRRIKDSDRATHGDWEDLGPYDYTAFDSYSQGGLGRVNCIEFHPTDPNIFWVGTPAGGVWKTTNGGLNWQCITNHFVSLGVTEIAVNYLNPDIIYILTGDGDGGDSPSLGVLKTTDGGLTWQTTGLSFNESQNYLGYDLVLHPTIPSFMFVALQSNDENPTILYSNNSGDTWVPVLSGMTVWDIDFKPGNPSVIYAATSMGLYKSVTNGSSFIPSNTGLPAPGTFVRFEIAVSPSQPENLYAVFGGDHPAGTFGGLFKSTNSGASFVMQSNTPNILSPTNDGGGTKNQAGYDLDIIVDPVNDNIVFVGGINIWKSTNSGVSWNRETWWTRNEEPVNPYVHADMHCLRFRGARLYSCNDGGVYYTDDAGNSFTEISNGLGIMQFYDIAVHDGNYMGGTQDNGTNGTSVGNLEANHLLNGDGFGCTWHNSDHSIQFLSWQGGIYRRQFGTNLPIISENDAFWYTKLTMSTSNNHLFAIKNLNRLIRGYEITWPNNWGWYDSGTATYTSAIIKGYRQGVTDPNIMYVASDSVLLKSTSIFTLPTPPWSALPHPEPNLYYSGIEIDPNDAQKVWVICGGYQDGKKVYHSVDGGMTWTNISGSLPNIPLRSIVRDAGNKLYVGSEGGVFYKSSAASDWVYFSNGLPTVPVYNLKISGNYLYAGTYGRGIWRTEKFTPCETNLTLTPMNDTSDPFTPGTAYYTADNTITSTRILSGSLGTHNYYQAGQKIELLDGFWAKEGTVLNAKIGGCPD